MRIAAALLAGLLAVQPALAQTGVPSPWVLETDESLYYVEGAQAPAPLRGVYAHGIRGAGGPVWAAGLDSNAIVTACGARLRFTFAVPRPADTPDHIATEFWFFRAGNQALYLQRLWEIQAVDDCEARIVSNTGLARTIIFGDRRTEFYLRPGGQYEVQSIAPHDEGYGGKIPEWLLAPVPTDQRPDGASRWREAREDGLSAAGEVCYDNSLAFHFQTQCFIERSGPWRGYLTYIQSEDDDGGNHSEYRILELDTNARLDGRLFEWDRAITFSESP